jgi:hypothetical protein
MLIIVQPRFVVQDHFIVVIYIILILRLNDIMRIHVPCTSFVKWRIFILRNFFIICVQYYTIILL